MKIKDFWKAEKAVKEIKALENVNFPTGIKDKDGSRNDGSGIVDETHGELIVKTKHRFDVIGETNEYGNYFISLDGIALNAQESTKIITALDQIKKDRLKGLNELLETF